MADTPPGTYLAPLPDVVICPRCGRETLRRKDGTPNLHYRRAEDGVDKQCRPSRTRG